MPLSSRSATFSGPGRDQNSGIAAISRDSRDNIATNSFRVPLNGGEGGIRIRLNPSRAYTDFSRTSDVTDFTLESTIPRRLGEIGQAIDGNQRKRVQTLGERCRLERGTADEPTARFWFRFGSCTPTSVACHSADLFTGLEDARARRTGAQIVGGDDRSKATPNCHSSAQQRSLQGPSEGSESLC